MTDPPPKKKSSNRVPIHAAEDARGHAACDVRPRPVHEQQVRRRAQPVLVCKWQLYNV